MHTAGGSAETPYLAGGTASGGSLPYNNTVLTTLHLGPYETYSITYSATPTTHVRSIR